MLICGCTRKLYVLAIAVHALPRPIPTARRRLAPNSRGFVSRSSALAAVAPSAPSSPSPSLSPSPQPTLFVSLRLVSTRRLSFALVSPSRLSGEAIARARVRSSSALQSAFGVASARVSQSARSHLPEPNPLLPSQLPLVFLRRVRSCTIRRGRDVARRADKCAERCWRTQLSRIAC